MRQPFQPRPVLTAGRRYGSCRWHELPLCAKGGDGTPHQRNGADSFGFTDRVRKKKYTVGGWGSVNPNTKGPAIYDLLESYIKAQGDVTPSSQSVGNC